MLEARGVNLGIFEDVGYRNLLPLTWLRSPCELRCGIDRLLDKAQQHFQRGAARLWLRDSVHATVHQRVRLAEVAEGEPWCLLNARALVTADVTPPPPGVAWTRNGDVVAVGLAADAVEELAPEHFLDEEAVSAWLNARGTRREPAPESIRLIEYPWHLPLANHEELIRQCRAGGLHEGHIHPGAHLVNGEEIHVAAGAVVKPGVVLDAENGPIHIAEKAVIQPNAVIEGPAYIGPGATIRPLASIRAATSIGPVCKVGGEIEASIFHGYSNKQHDGFLGHSYVAEWVNLGADTITSDLKNTYGAIRVYVNGTGVESGQHFVGATIGDHAKTGIGTILPTACVIGVASNVFTQAAVPRFVPSFAWLTDAGLTNYRLDKAIHIARTVMARRDVHLADCEVALLERVAELARRIEAPGWA